MPYLEKRRDSKKYGHKAQEDREIPGPHVLQGADILEAPKVCHDGAKYDNASRDDGFRFIQGHCEKSEYLFVGLLLLGQVGGQTGRVHVLDIGADLLH